MSHVQKLLACIDLGAVISDSTKERDSLAPGWQMTDPRSCRGKVLLLITVRGVEIVQVPDVLH